MDLLTEYLDVLKEDHPGIIWKIKENNDLFSVFITDNDVINISITNGTEKDIIDSLKAHFKE